MRSAPSPETPAFLLFFFGNFVRKKSGPNKEVEPARLGILGRNGISFSSLTDQLQKYGSANPRIHCRVPSRTVAERHNPVNTYLPANHLVSFWKPAPRVSVYSASNVITTLRQQPKGETSNQPNTTIPLASTHDSRLSPTEANLSPVSSFITPKRRPQHVSVRTSHVDLIHSPPVPCLLVRRPVAGTPEKATESNH